MIKFYLEYDTRLYILKEKTYVANLSKKEFMEQIQLR